ncbi:MAG: hypothetical protein EOO17_01560 [Chloroflexi bacterium]|nr:MAG: hypothetical protein EOO17_01560 [Chloroflexota bacterium]
MSNRFEEQPPDSNSDAGIDQTDDHIVDSVDTLESLIERSNFYNIPELQDAATAIIDGLIAPDTNDSQLKLAWIEYAKLIEGIVEANKDRIAYARAQIEAIIHKALIFQSAGNLLRYLEELDRAEVYAHNEGIDEISTIINNKIKNTLEPLAMSSEVLVLRLRGCISEVNRDFLRDLIEAGDDFEDMLNHAYGMILEDGGDPDVVFAELGII